MIGEAPSPVIAYLICAATLEQGTACCIAFIECKDIGHGIYAVNNQTWTPV